MEKKHEIKQKGHGYRFEVFAASVVTAARVVISKIARTNQGPVPTMNHARSESSGAVRVPSNAF